MELKRSIFLSGLILYSSIRLHGASAQLSGTNTWTGGNTYSGLVQWLTTNDYFTNGGPQISIGFWLNGVFYTNLATQAGGSNITYITNNFYTTNNYVTNITSTTNNYITNNFNYNFTNVIFSSFLMLPWQIVGSTNYYRPDFNSGFLYGTIRATNNILISGITNCTQGALFSFNIYNVSGSNIVLWITNIFPVFYPVGWVTNGNYIYTILPPANDFRMTIQSNVILSTTWQVYPTVSTLFGMNNTWTGNQIFAGNWSLTNGWTFTTDPNGSIVLTNSITGAVTIWGTNGTVTVGSATGTTFYLGVPTNNIPIASIYNFGNNSMWSTTNGLFGGISNATGVKFATQ